MRDNFARVLPLLFADEGGYCNDAGDPGGPTKWGIIYDDLVVWRGCKRGAPLAARIAAVKAVDQAEAAAIYKAKYWDSLRCDDLPAGVDYAVFDFGVNSGIGRAAKYLQGVVGLLSIEADKFCDGNTADYLSCTRPSTYYFYSPLDIAIVVVGVFLILIWVRSRRD
jgi:lysozyme family protein